MGLSRLKFVVPFLVVLSAPVSALAGEGKGCGDPRPRISFVEIQSLDLTKRPPAPLTVKGKLSLPVEFDSHARCFSTAHTLAAVVLLHGSSGPDQRIDFYTEALNAAGLATLSIDMWEARGVGGGASRPSAPILTYPDAFAALQFLANQDFIDPDRIGVLGFSWGGVMALGTAEQLYSAMFGGGRHFAAHVAHYPVCYAWNNPKIVYPSTPAQAGTQFLNLTGAPILIQIGSEDDYDNGTQHCQDLAASVPAAKIEVQPYQGAAHAWDRLWVPITVNDPFGDEGSIMKTGVAPPVQLSPNVELAYEARQRAVRYLKQHLRSKGDHDD